MGTNGKCNNSNAPLPPSIGLSHILLSNIPEGPEYEEKNINTIQLFWVRGYCEESLFLLAFLNLLQASLPHTNDIIHFIFTKLISTFFYHTFAQLISYLHVN